MGLHFQKVNFAYYVPRSKKKPIQFFLKNIDLNIDKQDEFIAIVGHTGSGKSTLVQMMNALLVPTTGTVTAFDTVVKRGKKSLLKPIRRKVGLVFQFPEYQIFEETVLKDIAFGPKNFGFSKEEALEKAKKAAKMMNIPDDMLERTPFTLSGGEMRKVSIAGILASEPDVLILDEPTVGLDPVNKQELLKILQYFHKELHKTIIIITHDMDFVGKFAEKVLVLKEGEILHFADKNSLFGDEEKIRSGKLDYPEMMKILKFLKEKTGKDINCLKYTPQEAFYEISKVLGAKNVK